MCDSHCVFEHFINYAFNVVALFENQRAQSAQPTELKYIDSSRSHDQHALYYVICLYNHITITVFKKTFNSYQMTAASYHYDLQCSRKRQQKSAILADCGALFPDKMTPLVLLWCFMFQSIIYVFPRSYFYLFIQ